MLVKAYGEHALGYSQCCIWFERFRSGDFDIQNEPRGRPSKKFDDQELEDLLEEDGSQTQKQLADQLGVDQSTISRRLRLLGKIQKLGKWIPHQLNDRQQEHRKTICGILFEKHERKSFLHRIVTSDEKWIYFENPRRLKVWTNPGGVAKSIPKPNRFAKKVMLCIFWDQKGVLFWNLLKPSQTVNAEVYTHQLQELSRILPVIRPEWEKRWENGKHVILLHDNAPSHTSKLVQDKIHELKWKLLPHAPYSPDLAPSDYHLFTSMANDLLECHFKDFEEVQNWVSHWIAEKDEEFFKRGIRKLPERWQRCITSDGEYFE